MVTFTIVSVLVGALLGMRFRVFILLPVVLLTVAIVAAVGLARESGAWRILLEIVVVMAALELGYLGGSVGARILVGVTQVSGCPWRGPVQWPSSSN